MNKHSESEKRIQFVKIVKQAESETAKDILKFKYLETIKLKKADTTRAIN